MKTLQIFLAVIVLVILSGCNAADKNKEILTVDFQTDSPLRYEFVSSRSIYVDWNATKDSTGPDKNKPAEYTEFMKVVVVYTPVEINPYGVSVIEAKCESAYVNHTKRAGRESEKTDAVTSLAGKTFRLSIGANGEITDYSELKKVMMEAGEKAFRRGRGLTVKEPDMLGDFIATQWFLWDSVSSIKNPAKGAGVGQSWDSQLSLPMPMVLKAARDVKYTLSEIRPSEKGRLASITSDYSLAGVISRDWPLPYPDGSFQMSGAFGFFRNYKLLSLEGKGEELFNIDLGRIEKYHQSYNLKLEAGMPIAINVTPKIYIEQNLAMELLDKR